MDSEKLKHVMKLFILLQLSYSPLVWMLSEKGHEQSIEAKQSVNPLNEIDAIQHH